jgi:SPX domain
VTGAPLPLREILPLLEPEEAAFFTALDAELEKIEKFFLDRERESVVRTRALEEQLRELGQHRRIFYVSVLSQRVVFYFAHAGLSFFFSNYVPLCYMYVRPSRLHTPATPE